VPLTTRRERGKIAKISGSVIFNLAAAVFVLLCTGVFIFVK
jgi:hypothetical protein